MNKINLLIIGAIFLFLTISCSSMMKGKELAEPAVENFHSQLNAEKYSEIYAQSDEELKKTASEQQMTELLAAVHRKLGTVNNSTPQSWNVNTTTSGTFATLVCDVDFSEGKAKEQFVFRIADDKAILAGYNINSPTLITK